MYLARRDVAGQARMGNRENAAGRLASRGHLDIKETLGHLCLCTYNGTTILQNASTAFRLPQFHKLSDHLLP